MCVCFIIHIIWIKVYTLYINLLLFLWNAYSTISSWCAKEHNCDHSFVMFFFLSSIQLNFSSASTDCPLFPIIRSESPLPDKNLPKTSSFLCFVMFMLLFSIHFLANFYCMFVFDSDTVGSSSIPNFGWFNIVFVSQICAPSMMTIIGLVF